MDTHTVSSRRNLLKGLSLAGLAGAASTIALAVPAISAVTPVAVTPAERYRRAHLQAVLD